MRERKRKRKKVKEREREKGREREGERDCNVPSLNLVGRGNGFSNGNKKRKK